jgi:hypothetical protein
MPENHSTPTDPTTPEVPIYTCGDCGVTEGALHDYFPLCDMEACPLCCGQLLSCPHHHDPENVLKAGRIPFIHFPGLCAKCGAVDPDFFHVSDQQWRLVVPAPWRHLILCERCYHHIAMLQGLVERAPRKKRQPRKSKTTAGSSQ